MARLNFPSNFLLQRILFNAIVAKDTTDGATSVIRQFLTEESIVLSNDAGFGTSADGFETTRSQKSKHAETKREERDNLFDPVFSHQRGSVQFLKKLYRKAPHKLGDWGVTVDGNGRVALPASFIDQAALFLEFKAHHDGFAAGTSPLIPFLTENDIDLDDDETATSDAKAAHGIFNASNAEAEEATANRDNKWSLVADHMRGIGAFLMNLYSNNPKKTGAWGFVVDDSPRKPVTRTSKIKPASVKTISGVLIGSSIKNIGEVPLKIYKGATATGAFSTLAPNNEFGVTAGFSTVTVSNEDLIKTGTFNYTVSR